jgi:H+/gluconate symporter-like permease
MAAILIVLAGIVATLYHYIGFPKQTEESHFEFGSNVINALSIAWIMLVLARNESKTDDMFGKAIRRELSTILLMIFVSASYSMLKLFKAL